MIIDNRAISISLVTLATIAVFYVLVIGKAFLVPLAVAVMVWYVINALSRTYARLLPWVSEKNWITTLASLISIGLFIFFAIEMVQNNIVDVQKKIPDYKTNFESFAHSLSTTFERFPLPDVTNVLDSIEVAPVISSLAGTFTSMISNTFLVLIYVLFLMLEQSTFTKKIRAIFPDSTQRESVMSILSHAQEDIQTYLWIKTTTSTITGLVSYAILFMVGVDFAGFGRLLFSF